MAVCFRPLQGLRWNKRSRLDRLKVSRDYSNDPDEACKQDPHFGVNAGAARVRRQEREGRLLLPLREVVIVEVTDFLYT